MRSVAMPQPMLIFSTSFVAEKINTVKAILLPQRHFAVFPAISVRRLAVMPSARGFPPMCPRSQRGDVLAALGGDVLNLAGSNPHDIDSVSDRVGGALLLL